MLASMVKTGTNAQFTYDHNGLRIRKVVNGATTNYTLNGKNIVHMTQGNNGLHFFYDAQSKPAMVRFNGTDYFYVYNLQGDVVAIIDANGVQVVEYHYDAWGAPVAKSGSMAATLGTINPFRYRVYVYDEETGLYYLRSRYYNPVWKRFINADDLVGKIGTLLCHNQYSYCGNSPILYSDQNGHAFAIGIFDFDSVAVPLWGIFNSWRETTSRFFTDLYQKIKENNKQRELLRKAIIATVEARIDNLLPHDNSIYLLKDSAGKVRYVGRSNNPSRRWAQHQRDSRHPERVNYEMVVVSTGLTVRQAKVEEQTLISVYSLEALDNARREIAVLNLAGFREEISRAAEIYGSSIENFMDLLGEWDHGNLGNWYFFK